MKTERKREEILNQVLRIRSRQPRVGVRKLQRSLDLRVGRDRLFRVLREEGLLVQRKKSYRRTTDARHGFGYQRNLILGKKPEAPNEQYVSDITYLELEEGFAYLSLITDRYSRKIVGYSLSRSLGVEGCLDAARMALREAGYKSCKLIHHSDRGIQYCSRAYRSLMESAGVRMSMTERDHVYENALAESMNGILKEEFMLGRRLKSFEVAKRLVRESIEIYNQERLHGALEFKTPQQVHQYN